MTATNITKMMMMSLMRAMISGASKVPANRDIG